ncbi:hypothetical protein PISMIDRAFT_424487 [Pisolithus microcarpus 441]|uniref:Uncharacterized protein n=1 Tax=Pisolithus microcarpus 441 TaxID=765257 RepID=A0A0C9YFL6_9AGAM|nr:hypothetical protein BKA83DRAFT_424487 [Pisolithus microcarpus]KIK12729.1 hypothetical protein PISMIDRAFT_424487 [Pisolithus microcarpus 441]
MHNETYTPPFPGHAPPSRSTPSFPVHAQPSRSTVQHCQGSTCHGDWDCQLGQGHHTAAPVETWASPYPGPLSGGARNVSISEALQLPSSPSEVLARISGVHRVASSLDYAVDQNRPSSIDPRLLDRTQGHAFDYTMNHGNTLQPSYPSSLLLLHASMFGVPGDSFSAPTMGVGPIPSPHDSTAGQVIDSSAPRPRLPNPVRLPLQEPYPRPPAPAYTSTHQRLTHTIPSQSNSTSYPTLMPNQNSSSWSPQEYPTYSSPVQLHSQQIYSTGPPGFHTGSPMELHAPRTLDNYTAQGHSDHPSHAPSNNGSIACGWRDDEGKECGMPIRPRDCNDHYATVHGIKRKARGFKITCRWCPPEKRKELSRHNFLRHMREVHLGCSRTKKGEEAKGLCARPNNRSTGLP